MMALLLPYATIGLSRIAGGVDRCNPRGQPWTPAMMLPLGCEGLRVRLMMVLWTFRRPFMGRPVPRQLLRNALLDLTTIVPATAYHRRSYARDTVGLTHDVCHATDESRVWPRTLRPADADVLP